MPTPASTAELNTGSAPDLQNITNASDEDFMKEFGIEATPADADPAEDPNTVDLSKPLTEDEKGKPADTADDDEDEADDGGEAEAAEESDKEEKVEGDEKADAKPADKEKPAPLATFKVSDAEGEVELPEGLKFKFKANGKEQEVTADKLVRLAQFGYHNEELATQVKSYKEERPRLIGDLESMSQALEDQRELNLKLLEDDDFLIDTRTKLATTRTPEARAARAESELRQVREGSAAQKLGQEAVDFSAREIEPRLGDLIAKYPSVPAKEIFGMFTLEVSALQRGGIIPKRDWNRAIDLIEGSLSTQVAQLHETRTSAVVKEDTKRTLQLRKAQEEATKAKKKTARALSPTAGHSASGTARPKAKPITNLDEAADSVLDDILRG